MNVLAVIAAIAAASSVPAQQPGWRADTAVVRRTTASRPQFNYDEAKVPAYSLPDLLGGAPRTEAGWRARREALLEHFRADVYGRSPGRPESLRFDVLEEDRGAMGGRATLRRIAIVSGHGGREHRFRLTMFLPNDVAGPAPVFLLLNNRADSLADPTRRARSGFWPAERAIERGVGIAAIQNAELAPDDKARFREGVIRLFEGDAAGPRAPDAWGALAAWAWGARRVMDYLVTDPRVDRSRVAVVGHSRGGKAALWAGAEDERFWMVVSNESGEGGAALARRHFGETVAQITTAFPHWFAGRYASFAGRPHELRVDQHMLLALVAPRALYVASADEDLWADPRGEWLSLVHASPAFEIFGARPLRAEEMPALGWPLVAGNRAYHVRAGGHDLTAWDWERFLDFAERLRPAGGPRPPH